MTSLSVTCQVKGEDWQDGVLSLRMAWVVEPPVVEFSMVRITPLLLELAKGVAAEKGYWFSPLWPTTPCRPVPARAGPR